LSLNNEFLKYVKGGEFMKELKWDRLFINGIWKEGSSQHIYSNLNPYTDETIAKIRLANRKNIDEAYEAAQHAQKDWEQIPAEVKTAIIEKTIAILEHRTEEIASLLTAEAGSSYFKAHLEVGLMTGFMREAATYPQSMQARTMPSIIPGKENRLHRLPLGVAGVIAPWNVPLH
jgi:acyl-CoA reductase-like NAD-dependent aldehyde dehydrogenase